MSSRKPYVRKRYWNEPVMGWYERAYLFEILRGLDLSYILISHELDFITATTDTVYTMQNGKIRTDQELSVHQHVHAHPIGSCPHEHDPPG